MPVEDEEDLQIGSHFEVVMVFEGLTVLKYRYSMN